MAFFGRTNCDLQIPYKVDPNPWKQHQNWLAIERWATYLVRNCLAAAGGAGVSNLLDLIEKEMRVAMVLTGAKSISEITADSLVRELHHAAS